MSSGCPVCQSWHDNRQDCGHWCHLAEAEDWYARPAADRADEHRDMQDTPGDDEDRRVNRG